MSKVIRTNNGGHIQFKRVYEDKSTYESVHMPVQAKPDANRRFTSLVNPVIKTIVYNENGKVERVVVQADTGIGWSVGIDSFYRHFIILPKEDN